MSTISTLGALDSLPTVQALHRFNRELDEAEAEHRAQRDQLEEAFSKMVRGDLSAPAYFAPTVLNTKTKANRFQFGHEVLFDALDARDGLKELAMQVLVSAAAAGHGPAQRLLAMAGASWAENNADYVGGLRRAGAI